MQKHDASEALLAFEMPLAGGDSAGRGQASASRLGHRSMSCEYPR